MISRLEKTILNNSKLRSIGAKLRLFVVVGFVAVGHVGCFLKNPPAELVWTMVNVNNTSLQGDAHLIELKHGKTIIIDTGYLGPAKQKLVPLLKEKKIEKIDLVFISHPHRDHYEGLYALFESGIQIDTIYFNLPDRQLCDREIPWGCNYHQILEYHNRAKQEGVKIAIAEPDLNLKLGNSTHLKILYAFDGVNTPVGRTDINDLSLIMMLEHDNHKILFTGDLNQKIGGYLAQSAEDITADVLKVPHHGTEGVAPNSFFEAVIGSR